MHKWLSLKKKTASCTLMRFILSFKSMFDRFFYYKVFCSCFQICIRMIKAKTAAEPVIKSFFMSSGMDWFHINFFSLLNLMNILSVSRFLGQNDSSVLFTHIRHDSGLFVRLESPGRPCEVETPAGLWPPHLNMDVRLHGNSNFNQRVNGGARRSSRSGVSVGKHVRPFPMKTLVLECTILFSKRRNYLVCCWILNSYRRWLN